MTNRKGKIQLNGSVMVMMTLLLVGCGGGEDSVVAPESIESNDKQETIIETDLAEEDTIALVDSEEPESEFCETDFGVYLYDPGESHTNVRNGPSGDVILSLPWNDMDDVYMIWVIGAKDGWFKFKGPILGMIEDIELPEGEGWVHHSVVGGDTRNYANQPIEIYTKADNSSEVVGIINYESTSLKPLDACGKWVLVDYETEDGETKRGWIDGIWICGNPLTNCS